MALAKFLKVSSKDWFIKIALIIAAVVIWYGIFSLIPEKVLAETPDDVKTAISEKLKGNPDKEEILATIKCESDFNAEAIGDHGNSLGLVQINLPSWPTISRSEALDPFFSLDFIIKQFALGHKRYWTCWRHLSLLY